MKIANSAKREKYSEKTITVEKMANGDFKVTAAEEGFEIGRANSERSIDMTFTPNGFSALIGSLMAMSGEDFYEK